MTTDRIWWWWWWGIVIQKDIKVKNLEKQVKLHQSTANHV